MKYCATVLFLFISYATQAQSFALHLQEQLDKTYQSYMPLKVHVFTNQPEYAAGDTLFFHVDLVTAQDLKPVPGKSILSIALLNNAGDKLSVHQFSIMNGSGSNQLVIPQNIRDGQYYLAVWNSWMTESNSILYKKSIRIGSIGRSHLVQKLKARPEGGVLVHGVNTKIVIAGPPLTNGKITEDGKEISQFTISAEGTISLIVTPQFGKQYQVDLGNEKIQLPEVQKDGVTMAVKNSENKLSLTALLRVAIQSAYIGKPLSLIVSAQGIIYHASEIIFKTQSFVTLDVPIEKIPEGITQLTLFDPAGKVLSERLFYHRLNSKLSAEVELDKTQFHAREKINVKVRVLDDHRPVKAKLGLTAFHNELTPLDTTLISDLLSDLLLQYDTEQAGLLPLATRDAEALDDLMILTSWRRFDWQTLAPRSDKAYYSPYMSFTGKAFDAVSAEPLPDSTMITFFIQKNAAVYQAYVINGKFSVAVLFDLFETDEVYYRADANGKVLPRARVSIDRDTIVSFTPPNAEDKNNAYAELFAKRNMITQSYSFRNGSRNTYENATADVLEDDVFGADLTIRLSDYQLFPTMIETLREIIPVTQHRKLRDQDVIRIYDKPAEAFRTEQPVYIIDGIMTDDTKYFLSLIPADVISIKVIHDRDKLSQFGMIGSGGVLIVETKIPDHDSKIPRSERTFLIQGLNASVKPQQVIHSTSTERIPDLRTNLIWLPDFNTDSDGNASLSFFASDAPGRYKLIGEGITADGKPFTFEKDFEVVFDRVSAIEN